MEAPAARPHTPSMAIDSLSAVTLATHDMGASWAFFIALGFEPRYGGPHASFTSYRAGASYLNVVAADPAVRWSWWGRPIFYVADVDETHAAALAAGYQPEFPPRDASWGERYFHILDPDGHELSFARPLAH